MSLRKMGLHIIGSFAGKLGAPLTAAIPIGSYICRGFALGIVVLDSERGVAAIIGWDTERKQ